MSRALRALRDRFSRLRSSREDIDALDEATSARRNQRGPSTPMKRAATVPSRPSGVRTGTCAL